MALFLGAFAIGMAFVNLYFVFDTRQTLWDLLNLFSFGFCGGMGIALFIMGIRER